MLESFKSIRMIGRNLDLLTHCNSIVGSYQRQGFRLSLRQLYYQLVTKNLVANEEKSYKRVGKILSNARLSGLTDWAAIEDRGRVPKVPPEFGNIGELVEAALASYRLPRLRGQAIYPELWVEKDALAGVLSPLARRFHVVMMVNKGYSSQSAMYAAAHRIKAAVKADDAVEDAVVLYLGDHDPSGMDMVRDIQERLDMFVRNAFPVDVRKIAINMDQIETYGPPPNPTKLSDSRAQDYIDEYGYECWEVDALPPDVLEQIISDELESIIDQSIVDPILAEEESDKEALRKATSEIIKQK